MELDDSSQVENCQAESSKAKPETSTNLTQDMMGLGIKCGVSNPSLNKNDSTQLSDSTDNSTSNSSDSTDDSSVRKEYYRGDELSTNPSNRMKRKNSDGADFFDVELNHRTKKTKLSGSVLRNSANSTEANQLEARPDNASTTNLGDLRNELGADHKDSSACFRKKPDDFSTRTVKRRYS